MGRVSKDPAVRRQELVLAACDLFKEKSFEQVSVSDIVKKVGVAQGTFYYYFETKYDMLDAVVDHYVQESVEFLEKVSADKSLGPLEKLQAIVSYSLEPDICDQNFIEYMHSDGNLVTHHKYMQKSFERFIPLITGIVDEGIKEGLFHVQYSRETVELMVYMYERLHDTLAVTRDPDEYYRKVRAAEDIFASVLGVKDGKLRLIS